MLNNYCYGNAEDASYRCDGNLFEGGANRNSGVGTKIGDELEWELNLIDFRVNWIKGGNQFATTNLPQQMRSKPLYFALFITNMYDEIEVMLDWSIHRLSEIFPYYVDLFVYWDVRINFIKIKTPYSSSNIFNLNKKDLFIILSILISGDDWLARTRSDSLQKEAQTSTPLNPSSWWGLIFGKDS